MNKIFLNDNTKPGKPLVATIGFFDGVHRGHQYLISQVVAEAKAAGMESAVITFDEHPRKVLHQEFQPQLLSSFEGKQLLLSKTGVDNVVVLHFDEAMASLSACDFMSKVLRDKLNVKKLIIGYDNRFGHDRAEGFDDYVRYGRELGIEVMHHQALSMGGVNVSSSYIRKLIVQGEIETADNCLGYPYTMTGTVVKGFQEGRRLGFPTANLEVAPPEQIVPATGVYAVTVRLRESMESKQAMMNIGTRPTFNGHNITLETYIFNYSGDLYGQTILVSFVHRIREEHKFDSPEALAAQLKKDAAMVKEQYEKDNDDEE